MLHLAAALALAVALQPALAHAQSFQGVGFLDPDRRVSAARGVSADGSTVVGGSTALVIGIGFTDLGFVWTEGGGMSRLGDLPGGLFRSAANATSGDGSVVVGSSDTGGLLNEAIRSTNPPTVIGLGHLPVMPNSMNGSAADVSDDSSVIVGQDNNLPFRWENDVMVSLGTFVVPGAGSANGVDADGDVIVGWSTSANGPSEAFRWTEAGGLEGLGDLPGGQFNSAANDVSADGSVVVGSGRPVFGISEAFRWTEVGGMEGLGDLAPGSSGPNSIAKAVSADGSIVVGASSSGAFIWTAAGGMQELQTVLRNDFGLPVQDWELQSAEDISADGSVIVGLGLNPDLETEGWVVFLPEPSSTAALVVLLAVLGLGSHRARRGPRFPAGRISSVWNELTQG